MSVKVRIPTQLRPLAGGAGEVEVEGATVGEALKGLDVAHPGFAERLFDDERQPSAVRERVRGRGGHQVPGRPGHAGPYWRSRLGGAGGRRRLVAPAVRSCAGGEPVCARAPCCAVLLALDVCEC